MAMEVEGESVIEIMRIIIGDKDPKKAPWVLLEEISHIHLLKTLSMVLILLKVQKGIEIVV